VPKTALTEWLQIRLALEFAGERPFDCTTLDYQGELAAIKKMSGVELRLQENIRNSDCLYLFFDASLDGSQEQDALYMKRHQGQGEAIQRAYQAFTESRPGWPIVIVVTKADLLFAHKPADITAEIRWLNGQVERDLADSIFDRTITLIKNGVETQVYQHATLPGAKIEGVSAIIEPSTSLIEHLQRLRERIYGPGGLAERGKVDRLLDLDRTYAPHKVRDVARFLGMNLLENFYSRPWQEAMNELAAVFEAKKAEFRPKDRLTVIEDALARAQRMDLEKEYIDDLKDKYAEALFDALDRTDTRSAVSDQTFLNTVLGPPPRTAQIDADTSPPADEQMAD
jgi:hypothetical protein